MLVSFTCNERSKERIEAAGLSLPRIARGDTDSTLIIYLSPSVRVSHIDPLGRVKCNVVCRVAAAHKGRDAHVVAAECTYMPSTPSYRPARPRKGWKASID